MSAEILAELARVKAVFQLRAIQTVMGFPAQGMSAGTAKTPKEVEAEGRQPGPATQDAS